MKKYHHRIQMAVELKSGWTDERTDWILLRMLILLEPCAVLIPTCIQKGFSSSDFFFGKSQLKITYESTGQNFP